MHRHHSCGAGRDQKGSRSAAPPAVLTGASPGAHPACASPADRLLVLPLLFPPLLEFLSLKAACQRTMAWVGAGS